MVKRIELTLSSYSSADSTRYHTISFLTPIDGEWTYLYPEVISYTDTEVTSLSASTELLITSLLF